MPDGNENSNPLGLLSSESPTQTTASTWEEIVNGCRISGSTVTLTADIDMSEHEIVTDHLTNCTIDGDGHSIKNLEFNGSSPLFENFNVKNLTFDNFSAYSTFSKELSAVDCNFYGIMISGTFTVSAYGRFNHCAFNTGFSGNSFATFNNYYNRGCADFTDCNIIINGSCNNAKISLNNSFLIGSEIRSIDIDNVSSNSIIDIDVSGNVSTSLDAYGTSHLVVNSDKVQGTIGERGTIPVTSEQLGSVEYLRSKGFPIM